MISDTHNDFLTKLNNKQSLTYLQNCKKNGVTNLLCSVFTSEYTRFKAINKIKQSQAILQNFGNLNYLLHIEDLGFLKSQKDIEFIISCNPFSCSLTWNNDNQFAGGNFGNAQLSFVGKNTIKQLEHNGIILDVAHLNQKSFYAATKIINNPIFCSHTGVSFVVDSPRNLSDEQIRTIIASNGYFGLFLSSTFMTNGGKLCSKSFAEIIYRILCRFDCENNLGIGSDFFGISPNPNDIKNYADFENIKTELKTFGVQQQTIDKIFYLNFENFLAKTKAPPHL